MKIAYLAAAAAFLPLTAFAEAPGITVTDPYIRSANPMTAGAFMAIANANDADCKLVAGTSDASEKVELHTHIDDNGVMKMVEIPEMVIPAGGTHALQRGADHVMFIGLKAPLKDGDTVKATLDFGPCGTLDVELPVDNARGMPAAGGMPMDGTGAMPMDHGHAPAN